MSSPILRNSEGQNRSSQDYVPNSQSSCVQGSSWVSQVRVGSGFIQDSLFLEATTVWMEKVGRIQSS